MTMRASIRLAALALLAQAGTLNAQSGVMTDLLVDIKEVEEKLVSLAKALPEGSWNWRPGTGVRSVGEVVQHIAADNYLLPAMLGTAAPAATGIVGTDYKTVQAYETRKIDRAAALADLEVSFAHLKKAMEAQSPSTLGAEKTFFGRKSTAQQVWISTTTHLHEHLGQLIAYARSNNVKPPWSR
jgi:uncharacterized damage-inducible protein DinB